jgi:hypothetical protein
MAAARLWGRNNISADDWTRQTAFWLHTGCTDAAPIKALSRISGHLSPEKHAPETTQPLTLLGVGHIATYWYFTETARTLGLESAITGSTVRSRRFAKINNVNGCVRANRLVAHWLHKPAQIAPEMSRRVSEIIRKWRPIRATATLSRRVKSCTDKR